MIQLSAMDSEKALIACAILSPPTVTHADDHITHKDFADESLGRLWSKLRYGVHAGVDIADPVVLLDFLRKSNTDSEFLSPIFWADIVQNGMPANVVWYCKQVKKAATLRRLAMTCQRVLYKCELPGADAEELMAECAQQLAEMGVDGANHRTVPFSVACKDVIDTYSKNKTDIFRGAFTGLPSFDEVCGAMMPSELTVLAARPGVGKTSLAMQIAKHNAESGRRVLFVSLEMSTLELASRLICADARVPSRALRQRSIATSDMDRLSRSAASLSPLPITLYSPPGCTVEKIRTIAKAEAMRTSDLRLIVVDYIGIVHPADRKEPRHEQVGRISRSLKELAREVEVPVLALCQLNRDAHASRPSLANLRDSGSIEQDADVVMFLHRDISESRNDVHLFVDKHRHAEQMEATLRFVPHETRFVDSRSAPANVNQDLAGFNEEFV